MKVEITQALIDQLLREPPSKRLEVCDTIVRRFLASFAAKSKSPATWYYRYDTADGKMNYQRLGTTETLTVQAARLAAMMAREQIARGNFPEIGGGSAKQKAGNISLNSFFHDHYLPYAKPRKVTWQRDIELFKRIDAEFGHLKLSEITRHGFSTFMTKLLASGLAPASVNHHAKLAKRLLTVSVQFEMASVNQLSRIPMFPELNAKERYMNDVEVGRLVSVLKSHTPRVPALMCLWLLCTGARCGEAVKCTWDQIDLANRTWRLPASNTKAKKVRAIPLNDSALEVLKELEGLRGTSQYVFVNSRTGLPYTTIVKSWSVIRAKAGLSHVRIHDLRHQYASFLVNAGRTLFEVQSILGHSSPVVTQRYSHLSTKSLAEAANSASIAIQKGMLSGT